jgi:signal transduction histidine kinase
MELINNTLKHAKASKITFYLQWANNNITLLYSDNGKGLSPEKNSEGAGLKSIEARVSSLMGALVINNNESGSFCASIKIPVSLIKN